jgi:hypothetical protein
MKDLVFDFYNAVDLLAEDGERFDYARLSWLPPVASRKARSRTVLQMHLDHLAYDVSNRYPDLEGKTLDVKLEFLDLNNGFSVPVLKAIRDGRTIAFRRVRMDSLNTKSLFSLVRQQHPELKKIPLTVFISENGEREKS